MAFTPYTTRSALLIGSGKLLAHVESSFCRVSGLCKLSVCCLCDGAKGPFLLFSWLFASQFGVSWVIYSWAWVVRYRSLKCISFWVFLGQGSFWKRVKEYRRPSCPLFLSYHCTDSSSVGCLAKRLCPELNFSLEPRCMSQRAHVAETILSPQSC